MTGFRVTDPHYRTSCQFAFMIFGVFVMGLLAWNE